MIGELRGAARRQNFNKRASMQEKAPDQVVLRLRCSSYYDQTTQQLIH